ncbi:hypothetical protein J4450_05225 [Candidatus Micrarchaeota archaeon]|nr:hypothetical protein [Candidatus Micrarchaeota archaeon]
MSRFFCPRDKPLLFISFASKITENATLGAAKKHSFNDKDKKVEEKDKPMLRRRSTRGSRKTNRATKNKVPSERSIKRSTKWLRRSYG